MPPGIGYKHKPIDPRLAELLGGMGAPFVDPRALLDDLAMPMPQDGTPLRPALAGLGRGDLTSSFTGAPAQGDMLTPDPDLSFAEEFIRNSPGGIARSTVSGAKSLADMLESNPMRQTTGEKISEGIDSAKAKLPGFLDEMRQNPNLGERIAGGLGGAAENMEPTLRSEGLGAVVDGSDLIPGAWMGKIGKILAGVGGAVGSAAMVPGDISRARKLAQKLESDVPAKRRPDDDGISEGGEVDVDLTSQVENLARERAGQPLPADPKQNNSGLKQPFTTSISLRNMTEPEAIFAAKQGIHLKQNKTGQYVGAPAGIDSPEALQALRDNYDAQLRNGALGADWYDRSRAGMREMTGDPLARSEINPALNRGDAASDVIGVTSAQRTPEVNFGLGLGNLNQAAAGTPIHGGMPAQMNVVRETLEQGVRNQEGLLKLGIFGRNINPNNPYAITGVNDIWHARAWGFVDKNGKPWDAGLSPAQHAWLDGETLLAVQRANDQQVFGKTDWNSASAQAAPWIEGKAHGLVEKKANAKMAGDEKSGRPVRSREQALQDVTLGDAYTIDDARAEAAKTYIDFFDKHTASTSIEQQPGVATGHLPGLQDANQSEKSAFFNTFDLNDEQGRSRMHSNVGLQVRPSKESQGFFMNSEGGTEVNPAMTARPLVELKTTGSNKKPGEAGDALTEGANTLLASMLGQESIGRHKVIEQGMGATGGSAQSLRFELPGPSTPSQLQLLDEALKAEAVANFNVGSKKKPATLSIGGAQVDTGDGVTSLSFGTKGGEATAGGLKKLEAMLEEKIKEIFPQSTDFRRVDAPGGLSGGNVVIKPATETTDAVTRPTINAEYAGQGRTVQHVMEILNSPEAPRLIEVFDHADTQKMAGELFTRNEIASKDFGMPREDIQNWLALIRDGRGREALSLVGKMALPAALGPVIVELMQGQKENSN